MKKGLIITICAIVLGCSSNKGNDNENGIFDSNYQVEKDSNDKISSETEYVYCEKVNDNYCRIIKSGEPLPSMPFNYELTQSNILKNIQIPFDSIEAIKYEKASSNDSIFTYYFGKSYIQVYKCEDGKYTSLEFVIKDKEVLLSNGLGIGKNRDLFNSIYPQAAEFQTINRIGICDESEFTEVCFCFENNIINKIIFVNNEFDNY